MTIEIHKPELEALIRERMGSGAFCDIEDALIEALKSTSEKPARAATVRRNLADVLGEPPFAGSGLNLERQEDYPRSLDL